MLHGNCQTTVKMTDVAFAVFMLLSYVAWQRQQVCSCVDCQCQKIMTLSYEIVRIEKLLFVAGILYT